MAEKEVPPGSSLPSSENQEAAQPFLSSFVSEIVRSPVNIALVAIIAFLVYKIIKSKTKADEPVQQIKELPKLRRDFTLEELKPYDGTGPDGRVLVAVNGSVYDVTRGSRFYGPGKNYSDQPHFCFVICFFSHTLASFAAHFNYSLIREEILQSIILLHHFCKCVANLLLFIT